MLSTSQRMAAKLAEAIATPPIQQSSIAEACGVTKQAVQGWLKTGRIDKKHLPTLARLTNRSLSWWLDSSNNLLLAEEQALDRVHNLRTFLESHGVDYLDDNAPQVLAELLDRPFDYCEGLISSRVPIDTALARQIEKKLGIAMGTLDKPLKPVDETSPPRGNGNHELINNIQDWRLHASTRSQEVIDQLTLLAKKNMLGEDDWLLIQKMTDRFARK